MSAERLLKGARILGEAWQAGERCSLGWSDDPVECFCGKKTRFCKARFQWLKIAQEAGRIIEPGEFGLMISMTGKEWDATGRTVVFDILSSGRVGAGPKGVFSKAEMLKLDEDTLPPMLTIRKVFPDASFEEKILAKAPVVAEDPFEGGETIATAPSAPVAEGAEGI